MSVQLQPHLLYLSVDEILLSLSMESGGPKSILVSMSQAELSQCLKQSIHHTYQGTLLQIFWQIGVGQCCVGGDICDAYKNALEDKRGPPPHR